MVTKMKMNDSVKTAIAGAVATAEKRTSAEIAVVVTATSDTYQPFQLMYGFAAGSALGAVLWWSKTATAFPLLAFIQAVSMTAFAFVPWLRVFSLNFLPKRMLREHAARRASQEFLFLSRHVPAGRPVLLLYVSLAEKYAHILHSRDVSQKIPAITWDRIISDFTESVKTAGLQPACLAAIHSAADALEPYFPDRGEPNALSDSPGGRRK